MREKRPFFSLLSRFAPLQCGWVPLLSLFGRMGGGAKKGAIEKCSRNHSRFFESFFCRYACVWEKGGVPFSRIRKGFATKKMRFFFILSTGSSLLGAGEGRWRGRFSPSVLLLLLVHYGSSHLLLLLLLLYGRGPHCEVDGLSCRRRRIYPHLLLLLATAVRAVLLLLFLRLASKLLKQEMSICVLSYVFRKNMSHHLMAPFAPASNASPCRRKPLESSSNIVFVLVAVCYHRRRLLLLSCRQRPEASSLSEGALCATLLLLLLLLLEAVSSGR